MEFTEYKIGDIASIKYGKMLSKEHFMNEGYPVYSGYGITGYTDKYLYENPMLIIVARGVGGTGDVKISPSKSWITNLSLVLDVDDSVVDKRYLKHLLNLDDLKGKLNTGSAQAQITINSLEPYKVILPDLDSQKVVSNTIEYFDNLIENNTRRIAILEEMARLIYREWFVHYRYPGYENDRLVDSGTELGEVPEGWGVFKLEKVIDLVYGIGLRKKDRIEGRYPVYGSSGIIDWHDDYHKEGPGIVVGRKGNVGSVFWEFENFNPIDTTYYIESDLPLTYVFYNLQNQNFINNDAAVPGLSKRQANSLPVLIPDDNTLQKFDIEIIQIFNLIKNLNDQNDKLKATRNLLLPKLISGKIVLNRL